MLANYLGAGIVAASQIVAVPFYVRILDADGWGRVSIILSWAAALMILETGATLSLSRHFALAGERGRDALLGVLGRVEKGYLLAVVMCVLIAAAWYGLDEAGSGVQLAPFAFLLAGMQVAGAPYRGALVGLGAQGRLNIAQSMSAVAKHGLAIIMALLWPSALTVALTIAVVTGIEALIRRWLALRVISEQSHLAAKVLSERQMFGNPVPLMAASVVGAGVSQLDRAVLSARLVPAEFGIYAVAASLSMATLQFIYPISQALIPRLAEFAGGQRAASLRRLRSILIGGMAIGLVVVALFGRSLLGWWLANEAMAARAAPILLVHMVGTGLNALCVPIHVRLLALHRDALILGVNVIAFVTQGVALYVAFSSLGAMSGAVSWICANGVTLLGYWAAERYR